MLRPRRGLGRGVGGLPMIEGKSTFTRGEGRFVYALCVRVWRCMRGGERRGRILDTGVSRQGVCALPFLVAGLWAISCLGFFTGCEPEPVLANYTDLYERHVEGELFDTTPVRGPIKPLRHRRGPYEYRCSECHTAFVSPHRQQRFISEHRDIVLDHGFNTNCLNCHHPTNRNAYVDHEGNEIPADHPELLCAKCHGPHYREWELGAHGRRNGYWDTSRGPHIVVRCTECHDPHSPRFKPMKPLPPPPPTRFAQRAKEQGGESHGE
jgi:hypothetical protein